MSIKSKANFTGSLKLHTDNGVANIEDKTLEFDCTVTVQSVKVDKLKSIATVVFISEQIIITKFYDFDTNLTGDNAIKQAYMYLKTLPEFAGATDC